MFKIRFLEIGCGTHGHTSRVVFRAPGGEPGRATVSSVFRTPGAWGLLPGSKDFVASLQLLSVKREPHCPHGPVRQTCILNVILLPLSVR